MEQNRSTLSYAGGGLEGRATGTSPSPKLAMVSVSAALLAAVGSWYCLHRLANSRDPLGDAVVWGISGFVINVFCGALGVVAGAIAAGETKRYRALGIIGLMLNLLVIAGFVLVVFFARPGPKLGGAPGGF